VVKRPAADAITWIPPDGDRSLRRGHQPAAELARALAGRWGIEAMPLLERTRPVARQTGLTLRERRGNVRGAFSARTRSDLGAVPVTVVLVDDVYTSGATASAGASALRTAGIRKVHVVTFARAIR
jgi:predicted amidophosphoribosyltransferase